MRIRVRLIVSSCMHAWMHAHAHASKADHPIVPVRSSNSKESSRTSSPYQDRLPLTRSPSKKYAHQDVSKQDVSKDGLSQLRRPSMADAGSTSQPAALRREASKSIKDSFASKSNKDSPRCSQLRRPSMVDAGSTAHDSSSWFKTAKNPAPHAV